MDLLIKINTLETVEALEILIRENETELFDYFSLINQEELLKHRSTFKQISLKKSIVESLDFRDASSEAFLNLILNTAIRLGDSFVFDSFYRIIQSKSLYQSKLIKASALFMVGNRTVYDWQDKFDRILILLEEAYQTELDNSKDAVSAVLNFYSLCIKQFVEFKADELQRISEKILRAYESSGYSFLKEQVVAEALAVKLNEFNKPHEHIYSLLDDFLGRVDVLTPRIYKKEFLIESEGNYKEALSSISGTMESIQSLGKEMYRPLSNNDLYASLQRGVNVIQSEAQLLCYMYAFGKMHLAKLNSALENVRPISQDHQVIDWGAGQAIGSIVYLEHLSKFKSAEACKKVCLVEPSELAIKRGALHLENKVSSIETINKGFDDLEESDFTSMDVNVHIFSNILDVELYQLSSLITLIDNVFHGENYFIIVSPSINLTRTARIDSFIHYFENKYTYESIMKADNPKGTWIGNWSRVIRVGKITKL